MSVRHLCSALFPAFMLFASCSTHKLALYEFRDSGFMYRSIADPAANFVRLNIASPDGGTSAIVAAVADIGSDILSGEAREKLNRAARPEGIAAAVASGVERTVNTYMGGKTASSLEQDPRFVGETVLLGCEFRSLPEGLFLYVDAVTALIDRSTGEDIWKNRESTSMDIKNTPAGAIPVPGIRTAVSIYNAVEFFKLSEKEIQDAILDAARRVGEKMARKLRGDYASSRKK